MKLNLFLSVLFIFTVFHLSKAGPLRLQKRAAFYIANETACVVDDIVYSNGEPIPTDDPCESCKCRPPGFACVLVDCKVKPGCRAVRRVGQCCPEYVCGCEHNGRMYADGEEIRDPKNPCYECHCLGSSIACAFVDCYFRDDCEAIFMPGQCCPEYRNCTRDLPDGNNFFGGNVLPPVNLLPALNDESVLPEELSSFQTPEPSERPADPPSVPSERPENPPSEPSERPEGPPSEPSERPADPPSETSERPADPTQPPTPLINNGEIVTTESKESAEILDKPQTTEPAVSAVEDSAPDASTEERNSEEESPSNEDNKEDLSKDTGNEKEKGTEVSEEIKSLFNSDTDLKKDDSVDQKELKKNKKKKKPEDQELLTTVGDVIAEDEKDAEVTEKSTDKSISTETSDKEKQVKNSAAENSKSLKLSDDLSEEPEKKKEIQVGEPEKAEETSKADTDSETDASSEIPSVSEESLAAESESESRENVPEEIQEDPKASTVNSNEKIKSEAAETVTIVVHVREKTNPTTEKDPVTETIVPESATSVTQENLLKSSELKDSESSEESTEAETASTGKNFEIFPSSSETSEDQSISNSPSTVQESEGRADGTEFTTSEAVKENESDAKNEEPLAITEVSTATQTAKDDTEISKARANEEEVDEPKRDEPTITIIRIDPNAPIKIEIITDSLTTTKVEEQPSKETTEETKAEDLEIKEGSKQEETVTESSLEAREEPGKESVIEKLDETEAELPLKVEESTPTEKIENPSSTEKVEEPITTGKTEVETPRTSEKAEERAEETEVLERTTERVETAGTEKSKGEDSTSVTTQATVESKRTDTPSETE